jgi:hypothetical protein
MPNHVHLLLFFGDDARSLNTVIGNLKRFIGYEIIKRLQVENDKETLTLLSQGVVEAERRRGKLQQLWQGSFDIKECRTEKFILQKLNYMNQNPCVERWGLCKNTYDYAYSSAAFYELGKGTIHCCGITRSLWECCWSWRKESGMNINDESRGKA